MASVRSLQHGIAYCELYKQNQIRGGFDSSLLMGNDSRAVVATRL